MTARVSTGRFPLLNGTLSAVGTLMLFLSLSALAADPSVPAGFETRPLGASGFVVDAPKEWIVEEEMPGWFSVRLPRSGGVQIAKTYAMPESLEAAVASECAGHTDIVSAALPGGGMFVQCTGAPKAFTGAGAPTTTVKIRAWQPNDGGPVMKCHLEIAGDPTIPAAICRSFRRG